MAERCPCGLTSPTCDREDDCFFPHRGVVKGVSRSVANSKSLRIDLSRKATDDDARRLLSILRWYGVGEQADG